MNSSATAKAGINLRISKGKFKSNGYSGMRGVDILSDDSGKAKGLATVASECTV